MNTVMTNGYCLSFPQVSLFIHITCSKRCCMEFLTSLTEEGGQFIEVRLRSGKEC